MIMDTVELTVRALFNDGHNVEQILVGETMDEIRIIHEKNNRFLVTALIEGVVSDLTHYTERSYDTLLGAVAEQSEDIAECYR